MGNIVAICCGSQEDESSKNNNNNNNLLVIPTANSKNIGFSFKNNSTNSTYTDDEQYENDYDYDDDDDIIWFDALEYFEKDDDDDDDDENNKKEATFLVTSQEMTRLKSELASQFPHDCDYMDDEYIRSVASKPYSKDMSIRRPIEYSLEKLCDVMEWRKSHQVNEMTALVNMAVVKNNQNNDDEDKFKKGKGIVDTLNLGCFYWHGVDKLGRPIIWFRASRQPWFPDVDAQIDTLIMLADMGIRLGMTRPMTEFVIVCDCKSAPPPHPRFAIKLMNALTKGYPDRVGKIIVSPVSTIVEAFAKIVIPLMPGRLANKLVFLNMEHCQDFFTREIMDLEDFPNFLGGTNSEHDVHYPQYPRGDGVLKFDFDGMTDRLKQQKQKFEEQFQQQQQQQQQQQHQ